MKNPLKIFFFLILIQFLIIVFLFLGYNSSIIIGKLLNNVNVEGNIFCFVITHPGNLNTQVPQSFNNCIKYCTDYR